MKRGILPLEVVNTPAIAGRLALYLKNWQSVTQDHWVLNAVQGYRIEFLSEPFQRSCPRAGVTSPSEQSLIIEEVQKLQSKGAVAELALKGADRGFYLSLFLVPKKDGGKRPVINLNASTSLLPLNTSRWRDYTLSRIAQKVRLDDQAGSKGCVLHDPHPQLEQTSSTLLSTEPSLPVDMSAIWPVLCSLGLY